jgi:hypothetical protein
MVEEANDEETVDEKVAAILSGDFDDADKIRQLHQLGFSRRQLIEELDFSKSTVYQTLPVRPENKGSEAKSEVTRTKGHELMKIGSKDMIPPEQALRDIRLQDGEYKLGFTDGMGTLIMAARYNQILAASQAEIIKSQVDIMREAKEGTREIATEAAAAAAAGVFNRLSPELQSLKASVGGQSDNPFGRMLSMMQSAQTMMQIFGMPMRGMMPGGPPGSAPGAQQPWQPPPIRYETYSPGEQEE